MAELRLRMAAKSRQELLDIVDSSSDEYTGDARAAAQAELTGRPAGEVDVGEVAEDPPKAGADVRWVRWFVSATLLSAGWILACATPVLSVSFLLRPSLPPEVVVRAAVCATMSVICFALAKLLNPLWSHLLWKIAAAVGALALLRLMIEFSGSTGGLWPELLTTSIVSFITARLLWLWSRRPPSTALPPTSADTE